jgi:hypothetical protein
MSNNPPLNNINGSLVNVDNSHTTGIPFSSNVIPSSVNPNVMPQPLSNIQAAASYIPCAKGGAKIKRRKINKISRMYKMKTNKRSIRRLKSRLRSKYANRNKSRGKTTALRRTRRRTMKRSQKGGMPNYPAGYSQYQNNMPMTQTYSLGGKLDSSLSALASPPPVNVLSNCTSCVDNYNRNTNQGFPSRGWW